MLNIFKKKKERKIFIKDRSSMYLWCNEAYAAELKTKQEKIFGKSDYNFDSKKEAEKKIADEKKVMESGRVTEIENKYKDGKNINWIRKLLIPLWDGGSESSGILGIIQDITEEKRCELDKKEIIKEIENAASLLLPIFNKLSQGNLEERIPITEKNNIFNKIFEEFNEALDNLYKEKEGLKNEIGERNREIEENKKTLSNMQIALSQQKEKFIQEEKELESCLVNTNETKEELEHAKEDNIKKEEIIREQSIKIENLNKKLEENRKAHKNFVINLLKDLEDKITSVN